MKIIVPTDFSITSYNALNLAKQMASLTDGEIHLIHVVEAPSAGSFTSTGETLDDPMDRLFVAKLKEKVDAELQAIKEANSDFSIKIIRKIGDPYSEIRDLIIWEMADIVIIGEKGTSDLEDFIIGSLTDKVVRSSRCPVITVNQSIEDHPIQNIVYATDLKEEHPELIRLLQKFQQLFDASLHIVKINTRDNYSNDIDNMVQLRTLVDKYQIRNSTIDIYNHEDEEYGIIYFSEDKKADLIAMGIHKKSGIRRLINGGDLAEEVAEHTKRPVLTYHFDLRSKED